MNYDNDSVECRCEDCGKRFNKGDEGDNERFCLRCQEMHFIRLREEAEIDDCYEESDE